MMWLSQGLEGKRIGKCIQFKVVGLRMYAFIPVYIRIHVHRQIKLVSLVLTNITRNPQVGNNHTSRQTHVYIHVFIYTRIQIHV